MNLVAVLVALGGIVGMAAVEVGTLGVRQRTLLAWSFAVALPTLAALGLLWYDHGASYWPLVAYGVVPSWAFRSRAVRRSGRVAPASS